MSYERILSKPVQTELTLEVQRSLKKVKSHQNNFEYYIGPDYMERASPMERGETHT